VKTKGGMTRFERFSYHVAYGVMAPIWLLWIVFGLPVLFGVNILHRIPGCVASQWFFRDAPWWALVGIWLFGILLIGLCGVWCWTVMAGEGDWGYYERIKQTKIRTWWHPKDHNQEG